MPRIRLAGVEDQVRLAFANLRAILTAAGCGFDLVDVTTFHTDPEAQIETVLSMRAEEVGAPSYPNWTAVPCPPPLIDVRRFVYRGGRFRS